ncbi:protein SSUH2 homolog [Littorina saxatilis]|uniref:Protein SSUH2 homolog n=1 Tax=Littorina saxatilis TaxID=31220 RepID=A0AAN9AML9_9CAEN
MLKWAKRKSQAGRVRKLPAGSECHILTQYSDHQDSDLTLEEETMSETAPLVAGRGGYGATPYNPGGGYPTRSLYPRVSIFASTQDDGQRPSYQGGEMGEASNASSPLVDTATLEPELQNSGFRAGIAHPMISGKKSKKKAPHSPNRQQLNHAPIVTAEDARDALLSHVSQHSCYGDTTAKEMTIHDLKSSSTFHYILETFTETRSTAWVSKPYKGQPIDRPNNGPAINPLDIPVNTPVMFLPGKINLEVPHTAVMKSCHKCFGRGHEQCDRCHGKGGEWCKRCNGSGSETYEEFGERKLRDCLSCSKTGRQKCSPCKDSGRTKCDVCCGCGSLKCFTKLTVVWRNHKNEHVVQKTPLPHGLAKTVMGQVAFKEQNPRVAPINHFPDQQVKKVSTTLINKHARDFPSEKILMQRQEVRMVPVTQVFCSWKDQDHSSFIVYGFEHKVYAPDYPQQCCCGCVIL